jgi:hypothetical protein
MMKFKKSCAISNAESGDDEDVLVLEMINRAKSSASLKDDTLVGVNLKTAEVPVVQKAAGSLKQKGKRNGTDNGSSSQKTAKKSKATPTVNTPESDVGSSGEESDDGDDDDEESDDDDEETDEPDITDFEPHLWKLNELPVKNEFNFTGVSGPHHTLPVATALPFEYFCLLIPMFFWERWAQYTNTKAEMEIKPDTKSKWRKTNAAEMRAWVGSVIWWTLGATQSVHCFWKDDYDRNLIKKWFSAFRWLQLKRFFKVSNPDEDEQKKGDKLQKIREIWDAFICRSKMYFWPSQQVGVDEAIKRFKGRCSFKQYIKSKPVRWGLKVFCLCCSITGYLWNATVYVGKYQEEEDKKKERSATHQTVRNLLQPLASKNHIVHMDNWFTSIPLFNDLATMQIWSCGTVRVNRKGLCKDVTMKKAEEKTLKKSPGVIRWASYGFLCYIAWFAKRAVHILTNCYQPIADDETGTVLHWFTEKGEKVQKEISRPPAVKQYNLYMGAVDMYDQYRSYIKLDLRSRKFWHPLFWLIIESALVNAWLIYKTSREQANLPLDYDLFTFRKSIVLALVSEWEANGCMVRFGQQQSPTIKMQNVRLVRYHLKKLDDNEGSRFISKDHHFSFLSNLPIPSTSKLKKRQMRCRQCRQKRTVYWCKSCEVPLCRAPCFIQFHSKTENKVRDMVDNSGKQDAFLLQTPRSLEL